MLPLGGSWWAVRHVVTHGLSYWEIVCTSAPRARSSMSLCSATAWHLRPFRPKAFAKILVLGKWARSAVSSGNKSFRFSASQEQFAARVVPAGVDCGLLLRPS